MPAVASSAFGHDQPWCWFNQTKRAGLVSTNDDRRGPRQTAPAERELLRGLGAAEAGERLYESHRTTVVVGIFGVYAAASRADVGALLRGFEAAARLPP